MREAWRTRSFGVIKIGSKILKYVLSKMRNKNFVSLFL